MKKLKKFFRIIFILFLFSSASSQLQFPPGVEWQTIETEHFWVHFPSSQLSLAQEIASLAEEVHHHVSYFLHHQPVEKTHLVISNFWDFANGFAVPLFYNAIYISPVQCKLGLGHYDDFITSLLIHEYCHIIDLDLTGGLPELIRLIVGRLYTPNSFSPLWMIEGFATLIETELTSGGRGIDPFYEMWLRTAFLEKKVNSLDQNHLFLSRWPAGTSAYLYGEALYRHLTKNGHFNKAVFFRHDNSRKLWPFSFGGNLAYYWQGSIKRFYQQWKAEQAERYKKQEIVIKEKGLTSFQRVTFSGDGKWGLEWDEAGEEIFFLHSSLDEGQVLKKVNLKTGQIEKIERVNIWWQPQLAFSRVEKKLYFSQVEREDKNAFYADLYVLDLNSRQIQILTSKNRAHSPTLSPEGDLVYLVNSAAQTNLYLRTKQGEEKLLLAGSKEKYFFSPAFSPDGQKIALSVWEKGGFRNIWVYHLKTGNFSPLRRDQAWDITPTWSPDGKFIIYASDASGVYNLFAYEWETGKTFQLTNLIGGAFCPRLSPGGDKIAFINYFAEGFEICIMKWPDLSQLTPLKKMPSPPPGFAPGRRENFLKVSKKRPFFPPTPQKYNPWLGLLKPIRIPFGTFSSTGGSLFLWAWGKDVLNQHFYTISTGYYVNSLTNQTGNSLRVIYFNKKFYPDLWIGGDVVSLPRRGEVQEEKYQSLLGGIDFPWLKIDRNLIFSVLGGIERELSENQWEWGGKYGLGLCYISAQKYPRSISFEEGMLLQTRLIEKPLRTKLAEILIAQYFRLPKTKHHVIALTGLGQHQQKKEEISTSLLLSLEYRFPLWVIERGYSTWPFYLQKLSGLAGYDYLWEKEHKEGEWGVGLTLETVVAYHFPLSIRVKWKEKTKLVWGISLGSRIKPPFPWLLKEKLGEDDF